MQKIMPPEYVAADLVKAVLATTPGFEDLAGFSIIPYNEDEVLEMDPSGRDWVGQYVAGSVESKGGTTLLLRPQKHETMKQLMDTIAHELGHALWELLDEESKAEWIGSQEEFADHFMYYMRGDLEYMEYKDLFLHLADTSS